MGTAKDPGRANRCARFVAASVGFLALLGASYLALAAKPSPTLSDLRERTNQELERLLAERDATSAMRVGGMIARRAPTWATKPTRKRRRPTAGSACRRLASMTASTPRR